MKHLKEKGNVSRYFTQKNITRYILLFVIFVLAAFVRLYQLTELPWGIHIDEAGLGVNAYSLAKCGVDRYLNSYPIYPKNFYGGQSPFYTYLVVLFIKLFNHGALDLFIVRFPMVLLSLLAYLAGSCIIKKLFGSKWHIFGSFLYAVMPYFMMQARMGLDCNALVSMLTISLLILIKALEKNKYYRYVILGFFWGLTYYTYALSYISDTLALLLISVYCLYTKKTDLKKLLVTWVIAFMMTIPLILMIAVNAFGLPDIMLGKISLFKMDTYRGTQFCFHPMSIIKNIPTVLKVSFFQDGISYSSFDHFFTMYIWSLPFFVMGAIFLFRSFVKSLKAREYQDGILFLFVYVAHFSSALFLGADAVPQIHRINGIFFSQLILVLYGIYGCANGCSKFPIFKRQEKLASKIKGVFVGTVAIVYLVSFVLFAEFYFLEYKDAIYPQPLFSDDYCETLQFLEKEGLGDTKTIIGAEIEYFKFSVQMDPYEFYNTPGANLANYKNYFFGCFLGVDGPEKGNVYIFRRGDPLIPELIGKGFEKIYEEGIWEVYY